MRRPVLVLALVALVPLTLPLSGQEVRGASEPPLRAMHTADEARDWEAVGRLDTGISFCTATLIAPDLVLTAAHCLYSPEGRRLPDADLSFSAGLRHGRAEATRGVVQSSVPAGYVRSAGLADFASIAADVALLRLDQPVPESSVPPMVVGRPAMLRREVTLVSYGADREAFPSIEEGCRILSREDRVMVLTCSIVAGSSGAPVISIGPGGPEIVAIVSGGAEVEGEAVSVAVVPETLLPDLLASQPRAGVRATQGGSVTFRSVGEGGLARDGIGARFLRP